MSKFPYNFKGKTLKEILRYNVMLYFSHIENIFVYYIVAR
jgi:hypothetical protein